MSTLTLVRHGQAMYDETTEIGYRQAEALAAFWKSRGIRFDDAFSGTLQRHLQTAAAAGYPKPQTDERWNEYDAIHVLLTLGPLLAAQDAEFAAFQDAFNAEASNRNLQRVFEPLLRAWESGRVADPSVEPFDVFQARVLAAFAAVKQIQGRNIVVFTSGGPIGLCVQHTLAAPNHKFLELNARCRNAAFSTFTFSATTGRCSLDSFNELPHIGDPELLTWR